MKHVPARFSSADLDRISRETLVRCVEYHVQLPSTSDLAMELTAINGLDVPLLVLTDRQTRGRGRGVHQWWSPEGALMFSLLVPRSDWTEASQSLVSLIVGLAICQALETRLGPDRLKIKWPNDVFCDGSKISGILIEAPSARSDLLVVGCGVNINNSFMDAPEDLRATATSLYDLTGESFALVDVLIDLLQQLDALTGQLVAEPDQIVEQWQQRCLLQNRQVTLTAGKITMVGRCHGIDRQGALLIEDGLGVHKWMTGTVRPH